MIKKLLVAEPAHTPSHLTLEALPSTYVLSVQGGFSHFQLKSTHIFFGKGPESKYFRLCWLREKIEIIR